MPAAGDFATYNEISATYFTLKFIDNKYGVSTISNCNQKKIATNVFFWLIKHKLTVLACGTAGYVQVMFIYQVSHTLHCRLVVA